MDINLSSLTPLDEYAGEDELETRTARELAKKASGYLSEHRWCKEIVESYYGLGLDDKVGVFLFRIEPADEGVPELIWVIHGDIPPLYIGADDASTPEEALDGYIGAMEEWVEAAREGRPVDELAPVNAPPTPENADDLANRLQTI